jgi:hypothetical protein
LSDINEQISELVKSGELPTKIEMPAQEGDGNPNVLGLGRLPFYIQLGQLGQLVRMKRILEELARRRFFKGELDTLTLTATNITRETMPLPSLVSAFIINRGPNAVYISINSGLNKPLYILSGETRTIDHKDAEKRIEKIFYWCDPGNTASLRVEGYY